MEVLREALVMMLGFHHLVEGDLPSVTVWDVTLHLCLLGLVVDLPLAALVVEATGSKVEVQLLSAIQEVMMQLQVTCLAAS